MTYRQALVCAYCGGSESTLCSRCGCRLCESHRSTREDGWCWACGKELEDELDLVQFRALINTPIVLKHHRDDEEAAPAETAAVEKS